MNKKFFEKIVKPILADKFPDLSYACGLLGQGSEILGIDDLTSRDHNWGLRLFLFINEADQDRKKEIISVLKTTLPPEFEGIPTNWSKAAEDGSRTPEPVTMKKSLIEHQIMIFTPEEYIQFHFGIPLLDKLSDEQWFLFSEQKLLEFTAGQIYYDAIGEITALRKQLAYYPTHIKLVLLLGEWQAIASEIAFPGRTRMLYDEIGSYLISCRLITRIMRIAFILEEKYIPYAKWFGSTFYYLQLARELHPIIKDIISSVNWEKREDGLLKCFLILAKTMKTLGLIDIEIKEELYYSRPIKVINVNDLLENLLAKVDPDTAVLAKKYKWGSINQIIPVTDTIDDKMYLINLFQNLHL